MNSIYQKTLSKPIEFKGVGLHSLVKISTIKVLPSGPVGSGIVFKRIDLKENNIIIAKYSNVKSTKLCTTLENEQGVKVSTVRASISCPIYSFGIDNALIEIDCEEVPIMDGSARNFLKFLIIKELSINQKRENI